MRGPLPGDFVEQCLLVLTRTPGTFEAMLGGMPEAWTNIDEGPGTWSPYAVMGHLAHAERVDWIPRLKIILEHGQSRPFQPFDREAMFRESVGKTMADLLAEFRELRAENLERLRALRLGPAELARTGMHPAFGAVTARQLLATWTAHDMGHVVQVSRTLAKNLKTDVGPWVQYLSVMG